MPAVVSPTMMKEECDEVVISRSWRSEVSRKNSLLEVVQHLRTGSAIEFYQKGGGIAGSDSAVRRSVADREQPGECVHLLPVRNTSRWWAIVGSNH